ncbi:DUF1616 domain-containing protein [Halorubrum sp. DTA46]|uniref:DUF1616 domain-containing protein n=1 Tax=Halorubrum sp. DTA46 TaxID=3402162 RepID=UPI003AAC5737
MNGTPSGRVLSWDIVAVLGYVAVVVLLQEISLPSIIQILVVAPVLLFFPGYALTTVLFPGRPSDDRAGGGLSFPRYTTERAEVSRLGLVERAALSVGLSAALLPLFAFVFDAVLGRVAGPVILVAAGLSAVMVILGGVQRSRLPESVRHEVPIERWIDRASAAVYDESSRTATVNVVLAVSVLLAVSAVGIAFAAPQPGATYTEFAVGTEQNGEFVTDGYPDDLAVGETAETAVLLENKERTTTEYHVVMRFERLQGGTVTAAQEAGGFTVTLQPGETAIETHTAAPSLTGENVRLRFLLYLDELPANPTPETAYRSVHVWTDVRSGGN